MKKNIISIVLNQYFLSVCSTLLIIFFLPDYFTRYKLELQEQTYQGSYVVSFVDLNNDNLSEKFVGNIKQGLFLIYDESDNVIEQWTYPLILNSNKNPYWFFDTDNNGYKEVYFTSQKQDSIFLNIIEPLSDKGLNKIIKKVFVDTIHKYQNKFHAGSTGAEFSNYTSDGVNEVFFAIHTGFAGYPRKAYKYNLKKHEIESSSHLTNISHISELYDINDDGFENVFFKSYSYDNKLDSSYTIRSDASLWFNVLDHNLNYLFDPIEIKLANSELKTLPFKYNGEYYIVALLNSMHKDISPSKLMVFSIKGKLLHEKELLKGLFELHVNSMKDGFILFDINSGKLDKLNFDLSTIASTKLIGNSELYSIDINENGINEWLNFTQNKSSFTIYNKDFKEGHSFDFPFFGERPFLYGIKKTVEGNLFYVQNGEYYYIFKYSENPYFYFKYLFYLTIYMFILGFVFLILKGQKIRIEKKLAIEKEIAELQIKTIKNQVDPHFVFNAINTISGLMLTDNKLAADEFICNFSDLVRSTLQNSDSITCTLQEEINYVEKYIQLQQVRFNERFKYQLNVHKNVSLQEIIPKHVLYSYVENAIKHGLTAHENGLLKIDISIKENKLVLIVEDNGGGFSTIKKTATNSTGNGMLIMEKIYALYSKLYKKKINHTIKEIVDAENSVIGVKVSVFISR